jgi:hypothetical protein
MASCAAGFWPAFEGCDRIHQTDHIDQKRFTFVMHKILLLIHQPFGWRFNIDGSLITSSVLSILKPIHPIVSGDGESFQENPGWTETRDGTGDRRMYHNA